MQTVQSQYISDVCAWVPRHEGVLYQIDSGGALNESNEIITLDAHHDSTLLHHPRKKWKKRSQQGGSN